MYFYSIYHVTNDSEHRFTEVANQPRVQVGVIAANSLDEAYMHTNNIDDESFWPHRSTSVGDVIQDLEGYHLVCNFGFKLITKEELNEIVHTPEADSFKGYHYINDEGDRVHTWDFEESIGE